MRYSGSPLPMGFGESKQEKSVCLIDFVNTKASVRLIKVPVFQKLESIKGSWEQLSTRILELKTTESQAWLEIVYEGDELVPDLHDRLEREVAGSKLEILNTHNNSLINRILNKIHDDETLDDLNTFNVFERCLSANNLPEKQQEDLLHTYQETITSLNEDDTQAE